MSVERRFAAVSQRPLAGGVEQGRMLQAKGLKEAGKFFAFATKGELVVKLPAPRVAQIVATGAGPSCEPRPARRMRECACLAPADEEACAADVREAHEFVALTTGRATRGRRRRT